MDFSLMLQLKGSVISGKLISRINLHLLICQMELIGLTSNFVLQLKQNKTC